MQRRSAGHTLSVCRTHVEHPQGLLVLQLQHVCRRLLLLPLLLLLQLPLPLLLQLRLVGRALQGVQLLLQGAAPVLVRAAGNLWRNDPARAKARQVFDPHVNSCVRMSIHLSRVTGNSAGVVVPEAVKAGSVSIGGVWALLLSSMDLVATGRQPRMCRCNPAAHAPPSIVIVCVVGGA